ncbi:MULTISPECIES: Crp/Fnr family transcriptional regulator [Caproicibacterium]|uniref:Crp/Fnr family transcriptional regulator n=1 Tax=Caproicibacterium argilliputei TaxID=3030016 RepID=A0AA97DAN4_9FIRM|nr:Crp/Fnr family transcriptional regulator [Caproicibacterium argilliputei]WOC32712.1 Crp/Fnr family transcriptional regulator [Caproicibacterium argilliputei]
MVEQLKQSALFAQMTEEEIRGCLTCSKASTAVYQKEEMIFLQTDRPEKLLVLLEGTVVIGSDSREGRRSIVAAFEQPGELFGEVFLFLNRQTYDHYAQAVTPVRLLQIPKDFLYHTCGNNCGYHAKLISNMLSILAHKAYFLNQRLQVVSCATLRQKIAQTLLQNRCAGKLAALDMSREELADYLNAARPSVSRELMKMQQEGLLQVDRRKIFGDAEKLQGLL